MSSRRGGFGTIGKIVLDLLDLIMEAEDPTPPDQLHNKQKPTESDCYIMGLLTVLVGSAMGIGLLTWATISITSSVL